MDGNILARKTEFVVLTEDLYGSGSIMYTPFTLALTDKVKNYPLTYGLAPNDFISVAYDVVQKFPADDFAKALMANQTELHTAQLRRNTFSYKKFPSHIAVPLSNLTADPNAAMQARVDVLKQMWRQWDFTLYYGDSENSGLDNNPRLVTTTPASISDINTLIDAYAVIIDTMKLELGLSDADLGVVDLSYSTEVSTFLRKVTSGGTPRSNFAVLREAFPDVRRFLEVPNTIVTSNDPQVIWGSYSGQLTRHQASMPAIYSVEEKEHGLAEETLFTSESAAMEVSSTGSLVKTVVTVS